MAEHQPSQAEPPTRLSLGLGLLTLLVMACVAGLTSFFASVPVFAVWAPKGDDPAIVETSSLLGLFAILLALVPLTVGGRLLWLYHRGIFRYHASSAELAASFSLMAAIACGGYIIFGHGLARWVGLLLALLLGSHSLLAFNLSGELAAGAVPGRSGWTTRDLLVLTFCVVVLCGTLATLWRGFSPA